MPPLRAVAVGSIVLKLRYSSSWRIRSKGSSRHSKNSRRRCHSRLRISRGVWQNDEGRWIKTKSQSTTPEWAWEQTRKKLRMKANHCPGLLARQCLDKGLIQSRELHWRSSTFQVLMMTFWLTRTSMTSLWSRGQPISRILSSLRRSASILTCSCSRNSKTSRSRRT